jgi:predicted permease
MEEEFRIHIEMETEANLRRGLSPGEARRRARVSFGGVERYKERARDARGTRSVENLWYDVRLGARRLMRAPALTVGVVAMFGLGLGASGVVFGILDRLVLAPPPHVHDADRVVRLASERYYAFWGERRPLGSVSWLLYEALGEADALAGVAAWQPRDVVLGSGGEESRRIRIEAASGSYWSVLGVEAALGRTFGPDEDRPGGPRTVVLSHDLWRGAFGGDPGILGRTVEIDGDPWTVVGVAPRGFGGVELQPAAAWVPLRVASTHMDPRWFTEPQWTWLRVVGRLAPGATHGRVAEEATAAHLAVMRDRVAAEDYDPDDRILAISLVLGQGPLATREARVAPWLAGLSLIVLVIVCANVANLLLARSLRERDRFAIQIALGGGRRRVARQVLVEAFMLAAAGGLAAVCVTWLGGTAVRSALLPDVGWPQPVLGSRMALFLAVGVAAVGLASGLGPAFRSGRHGVLDSLHGAGRGVVGGFSRTRSALLVVQAALSVVLLVGAGLFARSLQEVFRVDMGLDPDDVLMVEPVLSDDVARPEARGLAFRLADRLRALPGVAAASATGLAPFQGSWHVGVYLPGRDALPVPPEGGPYVHEVEPGYFDVLRLRVVRGRAIDEGDVAGAPPVVLVNETFADFVWPGEDPLEQCMQVGSDVAPCAAVVGVVETAHRNRVLEEPSIQYYVPARQGLVSSSLGTILVRPVPGTTALPSAIRREVAAADPTVRFVEVRRLDEPLRAESRSWRLGTTLLSAFGVLALVVASLGLYALLSFAVARRRAELAIRSAMGATGGHLVGLVVGRAARVLGAGVAGGAAVTLLAAPFVQPLLYGVSARDPAILATVVAVLLATGLVASLLPALRASRQDPAAALRAR